MRFHLMHLRMRRRVASAARAHMYAHGEDRRRERRHADARRDAGALLLTFKTAHPMLQQGLALLVVVHRHVEKEREEPLDAILRRPDLRKQDRAQSQARLALQSAMPWVSVLPDRLS